MLSYLTLSSRSCGVEISRYTDEDLYDGSAKVFFCEKRDSTGCDGVEVSRVVWPKHRKDELRINNQGEVENKFSSDMYSRLKVLLGHICSLDDMQRMVTYLSLTTCKEIIDVMNHVTKNIDEGRFKIKAHSLIITNVGMKENTLKIRKDMDAFQGLSHELK